VELSCRNANRFFCARGEAGVDRRGRKEEVGRSEKQEGGSKGLKKWSYREKGKRRESQNAPNRLNIDKNKQISSQDGRGSALAQEVESFGLGEFRDGSIFRKER